MRKLVAILTLAIYFCLSVIQVINLHYCHGELDSFYFASEKSACCESAHADHSTCCEDITIEIDFDADQLVSESINIQDLEDAIHIFYSLFNPDKTDSNLNFQSESDLADHTSPPKIYLLQHSFLFYG